MSDKKSVDQSHLGKKYFIDKDKYNCPFCNMASVGYSIYNYDDKIKELKGKYPKIDELYFDILSSIKGITSDQVHEDSYENYDNEHAKGFLELLKQLFYQRYVLPSELNAEKNRISELFGKVSKDKKEKIVEAKSDTNNTVE